MCEEARDRLWDVVFATYYDTYYEELLAGALISRWMWPDAITRVLTAVTATGSAVAGWVLWSEPSFKLAWGVIAGSGALFAIVHAALAIQSQLRDHMRSQATFSAIRMELETLRHKMDVDPQFEPQRMRDDYFTIRTRFTQGSQIAVNDLFATDKLANKVQDQLNMKLQDQIEQES